MNHPTHVAEIELTAGCPTLTGLAGYTAARVVVRLHGHPIGEVTAPVVDGEVPRLAFERAVLNALSTRLLEAAVVRWLEAPAEERAFRFDPETLDVAELVARLDRPPADPDGPRPSISVAVCTRERPDDLARCLDALAAACAAPGATAREIVVVDNAPASDATRRVVAEAAERFVGRAGEPAVALRYVCEPRAGLDWARNRAVLESVGEVIAFTDDDVVVDRDWIAAIGRVFAESPRAAVLTGSVLPWELETDAQRQFEAYGGFLRGWSRRYYRGRTGGRGPEHHGSGRYGTGANMAFRRSVFDQVGGFDPALDVGTPTNGGGDLEMYFRVLQEGLTLVYAPEALVWHRHRRESSALSRQLDGWGRGFWAHVDRSRRAYPGELPAFSALGRWWWRRWAAPRVVRSALGRTPYSRILPIAEVRGALGGPRAYAAAVRQVEAAAAAHPAEPTLPHSMPGYRPPAPPTRPERLVAAVREVKLDAPLAAISDVGGYEAVEVVGTWRGVPITRSRAIPEGTVDRAEISAAQLLGTWAGALASRVLSSRYMPVRDALGAWLGAQRRTAAGVALAGAGGAAVQPPSVSVVLCTADRPDDLRACLASLAAQRYAGTLEVVVVDNRPASGRTPPVVAQFPGVRYVAEARAGLAYARNAGILASRGDVLLMTDDDVVGPPEWVARVAAPFARADVGVVTGNVLPIELDTTSQNLFESYGGLGRGMHRKEFGPVWFRAHRRAVPTWTLGATANAAVRASLFRDPDIGLFDETLGPGTPADGCGEDTLVFYRALRAGWTVVYEPDAFVWHRHRRDLPALRRQIYGYSKGHVAYHLTTWLEHGDRRGLVRLAVDLPLYHARRVYRWLRWDREYPISLTLLELRGHLAGPRGLWQSRRRVRRLGRVRWAADGAGPAHEPQDDSGNPAAAVSRPLAAPEYVG